MARVDKTESAVGVVRANLAADIPASAFNRPIGTGITAQGRAVFGAGQSGIKGIQVPTRVARRAGKPVDLFVLADIVDCEGLTAGTTYYADNATGELTTVAAGGTLIGFTVEADRLIVRL